MHTFVKYIFCGKSFKTSKEFLLNFLNKNSKYDFVIHKRSISALFVSGDKGTEYCVPLVPYMDFERLVKAKHELEQNIKHRNLNIDLKNVIDSYNKYKGVYNEIQLINEKRVGITKMLQELYATKIQDNDNNRTGKIEQLKQEGKQLKEQLKLIKTNFYEIEDKFVHEFLNLPNVLHPKTPLENNKQTFYSYKSQLNDSNDSLSHLAYKQYIDFIDENRYYMKEAAAEFDIFCGYAAVRHFVKYGQFTQTSNPDFVRAVLLQANATPVDSYHQVMEKYIQLQTQLNVSYLTGGGSFESFLGAVTKLRIYPSILPLKWISAGRLYEKHLNVNEDHNQLQNPEQRKNLYTATQTNAVQLFCATNNANAADNLLETFINLCIDFYKLFNIHFRIVYVPSCKLSISESLRVQFEMYSPHEQRYICVGRLSNYTDFVSQRILFTMRQSKDNQFLYIIGGPILYVSRLIALLLENGHSLENLNEKLMALLLINSVKQDEEIRKV